LNRPDATSLLLFPFVSGMNRGNSSLNSTQTSYGYGARPMTVSTDTVSQLGELANWRIGSAFNTRQGTGMMSRGQGGFGKPLPQNSVTLSPEITTLSGDCHEVHTYVHLYI
jgi:hypothetical protein